MNIDKKYKPYLFIVGFGICIYIYEISGSNFYGQVAGEWVNNNGYKYYFNVDGFDGAVWYDVDTGRGKNYLFLEKIYAQSPGYFTRWYSEKGVKVKRNFIHLYDEEKKIRHLWILYDEKGWLRYDCRKMTWYKNLSYPGIEKIISGSEHRYRGIELTKIK